MTRRTLLLYIGLAILGFYILGFILNIAAWLLDVALTIGVLLIIVALINKYYDSRKTAKK